MQGNATQRERIRPGLDPQYDYKNQVWIRGGRYVNCGHPQGMSCNCYGRAHVGQLATGPGTIPGYGLNGWNKNTVCIYDGPSMIDGERIIVLVVGLDTPSINGKTGDMIQTFILRADVNPAVAANDGSGRDYSICGDCALRPVLVKIANLNGAENIPCYVDQIRGPAASWESWAAGRVEYVSLSECAARIRPLITCHAIPCRKSCQLDHGFPELGRHFKKHTRAQCGPRVHGIGGTGRIVPLGQRIGSYGDPAAVDVSLWENFLISGRKHTCYIHQWETAPEFSGLSMASIDGQTWPDIGAAIEAAKAAGFRWYRVGQPGELPRPDEIVCPESYGLTDCANCGLCDGAAPDPRTARPRALTGILIDPIPGRRGI